MSAVPNRYEPSQRLIDNRRKLARLYLEKNLTVCEIADNHSEYEKTKVHEALVEHGIIQTNANNDSHSNRGTDPPSDQTESKIEWSKLQ